MPDIVNKSKRKEMMAGIRSKNTRPELLIRQQLFARGFRYRLHRKDLPGNPDIILKRYNAVIFINGCFWHCHNCHLFKWPQTRQEFWEKKIMSNTRRDGKNYALLKENGWRVLVIWECSLKGKFKQDLSHLMSKIEQWIFSDSEYDNIQGIC